MQKQKKLIVQILFQEGEKEKFLFLDVLYKNLFNKVPNLLMAELAILNESESGSFRWRKAYIFTFLERDIPNLGIKIPAPTM